jgi:hypothetical protein
MFSSDNLYDARIIGVDDSLHAIEDELQEAAYLAHISGSPPQLH